MALTAFNRPATNALPLIAKSLWSLLNIEQLPRLFVFSWQCFWRKTGHVSCRLSPHSGFVWWFPPGCNKMKHVWQECPQVWFCICYRGLPFGARNVRLSHSCRHEVWFLGWRKRQQELAIVKTQISFLTVNLWVIFWQHMNILFSNSLPLKSLSLRWWSSPESLITLKIAKWWFF